jgi:multidrug resistance efflux pump
LTVLLFEDVAVKPTLLAQFFSDRFRRVGLRAFVVGPVLAAWAMLGAGPASGEELRIEECVAATVSQVVVAAKKDGVVVAMEAKPGMSVESGGLLGRLEDGQARAQRLVVSAQHDIAQEKAANSVDVRYADAAEKVAESEYNRAVEANRRSSGSVPAAEVDRLLLAHHKAVLAVEQAKHMQRLSELEVKVRAAELAVVEVDLDDRQIKAPNAGEVTEVPVQVGNYVRVGEPLVEIVRLDRLRVDGFAYARQHAPNELVGRKVTAHFELEKGRRAQLEGKLTFAHPEVDGNGQYRISAELANAQENGRWLLRPGLAVTLVVHLDGAPPAGAVPPAPAAPPVAPEPVKAASANDAANP